MFLAINHWIDEYHLADYASLIGLFITVIGFAITIWNVRKSRVASEETRNHIYRSDTIAELGSIVSGMEEVKNLMRMQAFEQLPFRLSTLRTRLVSVRALSSVLTPEDKTLMQSAITQFSSLEKKIDRALETKTQVNTWARENSIISDHMDKVHALLMKLKSTTGGSR